VPTDGAPGWSERGSAATAALAETWGSLASVCGGRRESDWNLPTACPGWSVKDQLSHLIGIERALLGEPEPEWDEAPGDHVKTPFAASNEKWIAARRGQPGEAVLTEFRDITNLRLGTLGALSEDEWAHVGPTIVGDVPYAEFMKTRVFDSWVHEQDVRVALGCTGGSGGLASTIALAQVQGAMGFVVGKKAAAPDGTVVRFSVSGPALDARQLSIGVEGGRARPVSPDAAPTVTLTMSSIDFLRLGCGRVVAEDLEASRAIGIEGDQALGMRVLGSMNFMF
jgi:uncharacterized protein (TIGR03083 family)